MIAKRITIILSLVLLLLMIPFIAMQFTNEVTWSATDFLIMGVLLLGAGLCIDLALRKVNHTVKRIILCALILILFAAVWVEIAVGVFNTPFAGS